jgi:hypothetical protein
MDGGDTLAQGLLSGRNRVLEPVDRFGEVIFSLIMALTFTCSISVATSGRQEIREMLIGALGCNIAWGIVDGVMFVVTALAYRTRQASIRQVLGAVDPKTSRALVRSDLPGVVDEALDDTMVDGVVDRIRRLAAGPKAGLTAHDLKGGLAVFLLVTVATLPVALPFVLVHDVQRALRISNGIALAMLFTSGWSLGRVSGLRPFRVGMAMAVLGAALVGTTIALGG